jgi:restriction system protein
MVRAEVGGKLFDDFHERSLVAIGWSKLGDLRHLVTRDDFKKAYPAGYPWETPNKQIAAAGTLYRFVHELKVGDRVVTYGPSKRQYLVGRVKSDYRFDPSIIEENPNVREVTWDGEVSRDNLTVTARNSLGAISTLFQIPNEVIQEMVSLLSAKSEPTEATSAPILEESDDVELLFRDQQGRAVEFIKDRLSKLTWDDMQELIAGVLRAMGYKTRISPGGSDRGKDIIASPDGFGFEEPRIVVEVKHRMAAMGSQEIRSFLGGRHKDDRGLYVSTGGFTKDAKYEAERANIRLTLMDLDDVVNAILDHYDRMDAESQRLIPLRQLYWPIL